MSDLSVTLVGDPNAADIQAALVSWPTMLEGEIIVGNPREKK